MRYIKILFISILFAACFSASAEEKGTFDFIAAQSGLEECKNTSNQKQFLALTKEEDVIFLVCCCTDVNGNRCCGNAEVCGGPILGCGCQ